MVSRAVLPFLLFLLIVCGARLVFGSTQETGVYNVELPEEWTFTQEGNLDSFTAPDESIQISILIQSYEHPDFAEIIEEWAGRDSVKILAGSKSYFYEDVSGIRAWGMLADDGMFVEISIDVPYDGIGAFLASLKAEEGEDGLRQIFKAATDKDVVAWLWFMTPRFADPADSGNDNDGSDGDKENGYEGTPFSGNGITAMLPEGWTASEDGEFVIFASHRGGTEGIVIARLFSLTTDDYRHFTGHAREEIKKMGGKRVREASGIIEFTTALGQAGMFIHYGAKSLLLLAEGDSPQQLDLLQSISPEE